MPGGKASPVFLHGENLDVKSQDSPVAFFKLTTPFAHAALADSQNTATMTVKQKSLNTMKRYNAVKYRTPIFFLILLHNFLDFTYNQRGLFVVIQVSLREKYIDYKTSSSS